jgi:hypothetical protein
MLVDGRLSSPPDPGDNRPGGRFVIKLLAEDVPPTARSARRRLTRAGQFRCSAATVARPVAVRPSMSKKSLPQAKWRDQRWRRGLNRERIARFADRWRAFWRTCDRCTPGTPKPVRALCCPHRAPAAGRVRRRRGHKRSWRDAGSTRNGHRRGRAPAAGLPAEWLHASSAQPSRPSAACTACTDWPRRRASSARASARLASMRWASWASHW